MRGWALGLIFLLGGVIGACEAEEPPPKKIEIGPGHRSCEVTSDCVAIETSCTSQGCECGVAINQDRFLLYASLLRECRGEKPLAECDFQCATPFVKCFQGACVMTNEPHDLSLIHI